MAVLLKKRLFNPGKRKLTARQKLFFGTKRQRAAVSRRVNSKGRHRVKNVGEIITLSLPKKRLVTEVIKNPGMAATKRRRNAPRQWDDLYARAYGSKAARRKAQRLKTYGSAGTTPRRRRRRTNPASKLANPARRRHRTTTRVVTKYRYRNPSLLRRRYYYKKRRYSNPGFLSSDIAKVAGILGGATITNLVAKQLPSKYTSGTLGYATLTAIAFGQGYAVKKIMKNSELGSDMMIGGLVLVAMKLMSDLFPSISLPFSLSGGRGLGLIGNSSFTVPQVPIAGSMGRFQIAPNYQTAINNAIPQVQVKAMNGINSAVTMGGQTARRRVGRLN